MGSEDFADWIGKSITLAPGRAHNGVPTIKILPPPAPKASDTTADPAPGNVTANAGAPIAESGDMAHQPADDEFLNM
jgi:hypothetical protein